MAFSVDQTSTLGSAAISLNCSVTFSVLPSSSAFIVVSVWQDKPSYSTLTVTDGQGNSYALAASVTRGNNFMGTAIFYTPYKLSLPGGGSLALTAQQTQNPLCKWGMQARSYTSSTVGTILVDSSATNTVSGSAPSFIYTSGSPQNSSELFISAMGQNSNGGSEGVTVGGFSIVNSALNNGLNGQVGAMADLISVNSNAQIATWSWSAGDSVNYSSAIVAFTPQPFYSRNQHVRSTAVRRAATR